MYDLGIVELTEKYGKDIDPSYEGVRDGVCEKCTDCCSDKVPFSIDEIEKLSISHPAHMKGVEMEPIDNIGNKSAYLRTSDEKCIFLKDRKCEIYETRPDICRVYGSSPLAMCGMEGLDKAPPGRQRAKIAWPAHKKSDRNMVLLYSILNKRQ